MDKKNLIYLWDQIKKKKSALISLIILITFVIVCTFAFLSPYNPNEIDVANSLQNPSLKHFFGTDNMGRDYFTRALYGGRVSLSVGFCSMLVSTIIGTLVGTICGYLGGWIDNIFMRIIDVLMSIPSFFLILTLNVYLKPSIWSIVLIISLFSWMTVARIIRSETLSIKEREYIICAVSQGIRTRRIIFKHIIPNVLPSVMVSSTINIAQAILMESSLSFLGLGVQEPTASWGSMLQNAQGYMTDVPSLAIFPGLMIFLTVLSFNILGDIAKISFEPTVQ